MPGPAPHLYQLITPITSGTAAHEGRTPGQAVVLLYLRVRKIEGKGGATQAQMVEDTGLAERTIGSAVRKLAKEGSIK
jgi:hypothetical protein